MKCETLQELKAAYDSGELSKEHMLRIDNDKSSVTIHDWDNDPDGDGEQVFYWDGFPEDLLKEALKLLGIPAEGV
ncbi:MAG: hypothetical protein LN417_02920 [Candidatus Thermoplasmatota archaeon]|nr:hypothetical protein [Candidatus Thermoplasmatota archaeon]